MSALDNLPNPRNIAKLHCDDDRGRQTFEGAHRVTDARAYVPKGAAQWYLERPDGTLRPLADAPAVPNATSFVASQPPLAPPPAPPPLDAMRLALEYGDRQAQLVARAYADAYKVAGQSWAGVVQPLSAALQALSQRVVTLETRLEEVPQLAAPEPEQPPQRSALDELAEGVLSGVVQAAASGAMK